MFKAPKSLPKSIAGISLAATMAACSSIPEREIPERPTHRDPCIDRYLGYRHDLVYGEKPADIPKEELNIQTGPINCINSVAALRVQILSTQLILDAYLQNDALNEQQTLILADFVHAIIIDGPQREKIAELYEQQAENLRLTGKNIPDFEEFVEAVRTIHDRLEAERQQPTLAADL